MKIFMRRGVGYFSTFPKDKLIFVSDTSMEIKKDRPSGGSSHTSYVSPIRDTDTAIQVRRYVSLKNNIVVV